MSNKMRVRAAARSRNVVLRLADGSHKQVDLGRHYSGEAWFCSLCGAVSTESSLGCEHDAGGSCIHRLRDTAALYPGAVLDMASA